MFTKIVVLFTILIILLSGGLLIGKSLVGNQIPDLNKLQVITTLYPLYDFVFHIGQDKVQVQLLLPPGAEPHSFEPKPNDIVAINQADMFVYTGKFMEPWAEDILKGVTNDSLEVVDSSVGVQTIIGEEEYNPEPEMDEDNQEADHLHEHGGVDPHIWLDLANAQIMVDNIASGLIKTDPDNQDFYLANAVAYKKQLRELDERYQSALTTCQHREIVYGGHNAFSYLAKRYQIEFMPSVVGFEPGTEPTANDLLELVEQINRTNLKYIFYEELTSPKIAQTLAQETGAKLLILNAAHNIGKDDLQTGASFLSIMEANLNNLKTGLECP